MEFGGLIPALQSNKVDLVLAGMTPTEKRKRTWTSQTYTTKQKHDCIEERCAN